VIKFEDQPFVDKADEEQWKKERLLALLETLQHEVVVGRLNKVR
jgi:hypothetical protein